MFLKKVLNHEPHKTTGPGPLPEGAHPGTGRACTLQPPLRSGTALPWPPHSSGPAGFFRLGTFVHPSSRSEPLLSNSKKDDSFTMDQKKYS